MSAYGFPVLYGLFLWWFSTGVALVVVRRAEAAPRVVKAGAIALFAGALALLVLTRTDPGLSGAYIAFTGAILVWGAQEIAFLTGWITGPSREPCPAGAGPGLRFRAALAAILYHELALAASGLAVVAACWGGPNQVGPWTFAVLFGMRISAKLNVFLGVPNLTESFLPRGLDHLRSFFARKPMNLLFPVSVSLSTVLLALLIENAAQEHGAAAAATTLLATLVGLALLEHWFLVLPLPVEALWAWGLRQDADDAVPARGPEPQGAVIVRLEPHVTGRAAARLAPAQRPTHLRVVSDGRATALKSESGGT